MASSKRVVTGVRWCVAVTMAVAITNVSTAASAEPFIPSDDATVLERLPRSLDPATRELRQMRVRLTDDPDNLDLAVDLARRYIRLARADADPRYNGYAQAALAHWWRHEEPPVEVLVLRATLRQNRHDFSGSLDDLDRSLARDPQNAQAWLTRAVILRVQGRYTEALDSCRRLSGLASSLVVAACAADVASLHGHAEQSARLLEQAYARANLRDPALRLWVLTILAEIAERRGDVLMAERHYRAALDTGVRNAYLLAAYADFLLDRARPREVAALLAPETRADGLLLRRALAAQALGDRAASKLKDTMGARFAATRQRGEALHSREEARFALELLERPDLALRLALENWIVQREPADALLVLQAATAAGQPSKAQAVLEWLDHSDLEDVRIAAAARKLRAARP